MTIAIALVTILAITLFFIIPLVWIIIKLYRLAVRLAFNTKLTYNKIEKKYIEDKEEELSIAKGDYK